MLLLLLTPIAQAADLKVATWNLEWLTARAAGDPILPSDVHPKDASDRATLQGYAAQLNADVIALQEVDGPAIAATIFTPDRYGLYFTHDDVVQRVGIAVRRGIPVHQNPDLVGLDVTQGARFHLRSGADLTLDLPPALSGYWPSISRPVPAGPAGADAAAAMHDFAEPDPGHARLDRATAAGGGAVHPDGRFQPLDGWVGRLAGGLAAHGSARPCDRGTG